MASRIKYRSDFDISSDLITESEWISDALLDGYPGINCKVVYPPKDDPCPNCQLDPQTGRSASIYKIGGPSPFTNFSTCGVCWGEGHLYKEQSDIIRLRVYWDSKSWIKLAGQIVTQDGVAQIIGYMTDLNKIKRAKYLILNSDLQDIQEMRYVLSGMPVPFGFRKNRYFIGYVNLS